MARNVLMGVLGLVAMVVVFTVWAFPAVDLPPTGPRVVQTSTWILEDPERLDPMADTPAPRRVPVQAWYPAEGKLGPVVVFIHGMNGRREGYRTWLRELASRGYVVVAADHPPVALLPNFPDQSRAPPSAMWAEAAAKAGDPAEFARDPAFRRAAQLVEEDVDAILAALPPVARCVHGACGRSRAQLRRRDRVGNV